MILDETRFYSDSFHLLNKYYVDDNVLDIRWVSKTCTDTESIHSRLQHDFLLMSCLDRQKVSSSPLGCYWK
jgi:hypothetical protein